MSKRCKAVEPLLSAWIDQSLSRGERALVAAHLPACPACEREVSTLARTAALLAAAPVRSLPPHVRAALGGPRHLQRAATAAEPVALPARGPWRAAALLVLVTVLGAGMWIAGDDLVPQLPGPVLPVFTSDQGAPATVRVESAP